MATILESSVEQLWFIVGISRLRQEVHVWAPAWICTAELKIGFTFLKGHGKKVTETICDPQTLKYLLSGTLQKKYATLDPEPQSAEWLHCLFPQPQEFPPSLLRKLPLHAAPWLPATWDCLVPTNSGQLTVRTQLILLRLASSLNVLGEVSFMFLGFV